MSPRRCPAPLVAPPRNSGFDVGRRMFSVRHFFFPLFSRIFTGITSRVFRFLFKHFFREAFAKEFGHTVAA